MNIIQRDYIKVKNEEAGVFFLVGEDRATLESDLSALISPPIGESISAFFVSDNTFMGGSNAINSSGNLSEGQPYFGFPTRLDNSKQVGIPPISVGRSKSLSSDDLFSIDSLPSIPERSVDQLPLAGPLSKYLTCNVKIKSAPIRDESLDWSRRFSELRDQRRKIADVLFEAGRLKEAKAVRYCGEDFIAYKAICCDDTLARPMSCGHRLCPVCMIRRSARLSDKVGKFISKMKRPKHIVLTVENVPKIDKAYFKWLRSCFVKLRHRHIFDGCVGGFYSIETTYNSELKSWHVHIHIVADIPYVLKQELADTWKSITGDSFIVDIKKIGGNGQSVLEASKEIAKYVVKPGEFLGDPNLVNEYMEAVKGTRLISTFGKYYNMVLDDEDEEGLPDCWCGKNEWRKLDGFCSVDRVFKDTNGLYRLRTIVSDE